MKIKVELTIEEFEETGFESEHDLINHIIEAVEDRDPDLPGFNVYIEIV